MKTRIYTLSHEERCRMCGDAILPGSPVILALACDGRDTIFCSEQCAHPEEFAGILNENGPHGNTVGCHSHTGLNPAA